MMLSQATLLIVEDEPELLEVMAESLGPVANRIVTAINGEAALKALASAGVDAIVTDLRMPVMDGVALLKTVRSTSSSRPAVLLVSGFSDLTSRVAFDLGADATLLKPVRRKDMILSLERALAEKDELWRRPPTENLKSTLERDYASLGQAVSAGEIAIGRGGFCIRTSRELSTEALSLRLNFDADGQTIGGSGIVRWEEPREQSAGIEILSLTEHCVDWVLELTKSAKTSFIPANTVKASNP